MKARGGTASDAAQADTDGTRIIAESARIIADRTERRLAKKVHALLA